MALSSSEYLEKSRGSSKVFLTTASTSLFRFALFRQSQSSTAMPSLHCFAIGYECECRSCPGVGRPATTCPGVPFPVVIYKDEQPPHYFCVSRFSPAELAKRSDLVSSVAEIIAERLRSKDQVLAGYFRSGFQTLLLLESEDIALVSHSILYQGFLKASIAYPARSIEQVWLARMAWHPAQFVCLQGPDGLLDSVNPPNFLFGPRYAEYWTRAPHD
jgi:hypothetical protein